jgi:hypothetical protein
MLRLQRLAPGAPPDAPAAQESTIVRARAAVNVYNRQSAAFEPLLEEWGACFEVPPPGTPSDVCAFVARAFPRGHHGLVTRPPLSPPQAWSGPSAEFGRDDRPRADRVGGAPAASGAGSSGGEDEGGVGLVRSYRLSSSEVWRAPLAASPVVLLRARALRPTNAHPAPPRGSGRAPANQPRRGRCSFEAGKRPACASTDAGPGGRGGLGACRF